MRERRPYEGTSPGSDRMRLPRPSDDGPPVREAVARGSGAATVLELQRASGNVAVARWLSSPTASRTLGRDLRAGTAEPSAEQRAAIGAEITPMRTAGAQWLGHSSNPERRWHREKLAAGLWDALTRFLGYMQGAVATRKAGRRVEVASFEGAGEAAKLVVDVEFGNWTTGPALTAPLVHKHRAFEWKAGSGLIDRTQAAANPVDLALWMLQTDDTCRRLQAEHNVDLQRPEGEEREFLRTQVAEPFAARNTRKLSEFDIFMSATAEVGRVNVIPIVEATEQFPDEASETAPSPAERTNRWFMWTTLVHEYIHVLEHPVFRRARKDNRVLYEGFCELLTEQVLKRAIPRAREGSVRLRQLVEGGQYPWDPALVPDYSAGDYEGVLEQAKRIRDTAPGGDNAIRAAYFHGHLELIGLGPDGRPVTQDAPGTPGPGDRWHVVVETPAAIEGDNRLPAGAVEGVDEIAAQHGITVDELKLANPGVGDWLRLSGGTRLRIPAR